jgi:hypothetical protein
MSTSYLHDQTTDTPIRGYADLPSGEVALVLEGGRVLVCKCPRLLGEWESERLRTELARTLRPHQVALEALKAADGIGAAERLERRRAATTRARDRNIVAVINDDVPYFVPEDACTGMTDVERKARTERLAREVPNV